MTKDLLATTAIAVALVSAVIITRRHANQLQSTAQSPTNRAPSNTVPIRPPALAPGHDGHKTHDEMVFPVVFAVFTVIAGVASIAALVIGLLQLVR